jgi:hypothetical protein
MRFNIKILNEKSYTFHRSHYNIPDDGKEIGYFLVAECVPGYGAICSRTFSQLFDLLDEKVFIKELFKGKVREKFNYDKFLEQVKSSELIQNTTFVIEEDGGFYLDFSTSHLSYDDNKGYTYGSGIRRIF